MPNVVQLKFKIEGLSYNKKLDFDQTINLRIVDVHLTVEFSFTAKANVGHSFPDASEPPTMRVSAVILLPQPEIKSEFVF